jgi:hypothetical protein
MFLNIFKAKAHLVIHKSGLVTSHGAEEIEVRL